MHLETTVYLSIMKLTKATLYRLLFFQGVCRMSCTRLCSRQKAITRTGRRSKPSFNLALLRVVRCLIDYTSSLLQHMNQHLERAKFVHSRVGHHVAEHIHHVGSLCYTARTIPARSAVASVSQGYGGK
jgi:hypothetical protein